MNLKKIIALSSITFASIVISPAVLAVANSTGADASTVIVTGRVTDGTCDIMSDSAFIDVGTYNTSEFRSLSGKNVSPVGALVKDIVINIDNCLPDSNNTGGYVAANLSGLHVTGVPLDAATTATTGYFTDKVTNNLGISLDYSGTSATLTGINSANLGNWIVPASGQNKSVKPGDVVLVSGVHTDISGANKTKASFKAKLMAHDPTIVNAGDIVSAPITFTYIYK